MSYKKNTDADGVSNLRKYRTSKAISADYTILADDEMLVVVASTADVILTLPTLASLVGKGYNVLEVIPVVSNGYKIRIQTQGADTYPFGNTWFDLPSAQKQFEIGLHEHGFNLRRNISVKAHYNRAAAWAATSFATPTAIPFDTEGGNTQSELLVWDGSTKVTVNTAGSYSISFGLDIDSTGGVTWNALAQLYKNGIAVQHADVRTGNYGSEDQSMTFIPIAVYCVAGDYLELYLDQNNLTGNLIGVTFNVDIRL